MINTQGLQQVLNEIENMLQAGSISDEEAVIMKAEATAAAQAEEESEDTVEETEGEEEVEEVEESEEEEEEEEEEVEESEEEEVEEVEETEIDEEEEEEEEEELDIENLTDKQLQRLEKLIKRGGGEDFDIENLSKKKQEEYKKLIGIQAEGTDAIVQRSDFGHQKIIYSNGAEEKDTDIVDDIINMDPKRILPGYITKENGDKIQIYEYNDEGERTGINPELLNPEGNQLLFEKWQKMNPDSFITGETLGLDEVTVSGPADKLYHGWDKDGNRITLTAEEKKKWDTVNYANNERGEVGPTMQDIYLEQLKIWGKTEGNEVGNIEGFAYGDDPDNRPFPKFKSQEELVKFYEDFMQTFIQNNSYINQLKEESKYKISGEVTPMILELEKNLGYNLDCDLDKENCFWNENNFDEYNRMTMLTQFLVEQSVLNEDPEYKRIVAQGSAFFEEFFGKEAKDFRVSEHTRDWLKFGFDTPLGYVPAGKSIESMLTTLGLQLGDKWKFRREALAMGFTAKALENITIATSEQEDANGNIIQALSDDAFVCVKTHGRDSKGEKTEFYEIIDTKGDCKNKKRIKVDQKGSAMGNEITYGDGWSPVEENWYNVERIRLGDLKEELSTRLEEEQLNMFETYFEAKNMEAIAEDLKTYELRDGWPSDFSSLSGLLFEQGPMMAFSFLTLGAGPALAQYQDSMFNIIEKEAMERAGIKDFTQLTPEMIEKVVNDDEWFNDEVTKTALASIAYGAMEFLPVFKLAKFGKTALQGLGTTLVRNGIRKSLQALPKGIALTSVEMLFQGFREGTTEFIQELIIGHREGREMDLETNFKLGFTTGFFLPGGINIVAQGTNEVRSAIQKWVIPTLKGKRASESFFNWSLENLNKQVLTDKYKNMSQKDKDNVIANIELIKQIRDANKKVPEYVEGPERSEALRLYMDQNHWEKVLKNQPDDVEAKANLAIIEAQLEELMESNKNRAKIRRGTQDYEISLDEMNLDNTPEIVNIQEGDDGITTTYKGKDYKDFIDPNTGKIYKGHDLEIALAKDGFELENDEPGMTVYKNDTGETLVFLDENKAVAEKRLTIGDHEIGIHALLRKTFEKNPGVAIELGTQLLDKIKAINPDLLKNSKFAERLSTYGTINENGDFVLTKRAENYTQAQAYEEILALFAEGLRSKEIRLSDVGAQDLMGSFTNAFQDIWSKVFPGKGKVDDKFEFNSVDDFIKFVVNTQKAVDKGTFTPQMEKALQGSATGSLLAESTTPEVTAKQEKTFLKALGPDNKLSTEVENQVEADLTMIREIQEGPQVGDVQVKTGAEQALENEIINAISPTVLSVAENRTKALYDPIPADLKKGLSRDDFKTMLINDMNLMVLNEWDPSKQSLEKFIVNRGFLRAMNAAKRGGVEQQFTLDISEVQAGEADTAVWVDPKMEEVIKKKKISPTKLLGKDLSNLATENVIQRIKDEDIDINDLTYKKINQLGLATEEVAAYFNIPVEFLANKKRNLNSETSRAARMIIARDAQQLLNLLPEGYSEKLGISTGVPNTILNKFYEKGERKGNITPWVLRKDITRAEFLAAFGIKADGSFSPRNDGQLIKGLMQLMNANVSNEIIGNMEGMTDQGRFNIKAGGSTKLAALGPKMINLFTEKGVDLAYQAKIGTDMLTEVHRLISQDEMFKYNTLDDTRSMIDRYLSSNDLKLPGLDRETKIIKDYIEGLIENKTEEGLSDAENYKKWVSEQALSGTLTNNEDLNKYLENGNWKLTDKDFINDPEALGTFLNEGIEIAKFIPIPLNGLNGNKSMLFGMLGASGSRRVIGKENELVESDFQKDLTNAFGVQYKSFEDYKKQGGFLDEETYNEWQSLDYKALGNTYQGKYRTAYEAVYGSNISKKAKLKILNETFSDKAGQAQLKFLNLQMKTLQQYLYQAEENSPEFYKRADQVVKLLSTSASLSKGIRLYSNPKWFYLPKDSKEGKTKYEHLMSANEFNKNTLKLILENKWGKTSESADILNKYNGIWGILSEFDLLDGSSGKTNTSAEFRYGYRLEIAKEIYNLNGESLYDHIVKTAGKEAVRAMERKGEAIYRHNYAVAEANGLGDLLGDTEGTEYASNQLQVDVMSDMDNTIRIASDPAAEEKGITVADFDDTVALSNSKVLYTLPDGSTGELSASDFAKQYGELQAQGAEFDFEQFNKVIDGKPGPMLERIKQIAEKFGTDEVYILTARDPKSAEAIQLFLKEMGLDIPIENIVGLADGTAEAKGRWVLDKTADGYNNWFFTDDQLKNVDEVKRILDMADVKSDVQLSKLAALSPEEINTTFNRYLESSTGIGSDKTYSEAKGKLMGSKARTKFLDVIMPYSAEDFKGLLYTTLASGKEGEAQFDFYKKHLIDPYNKAINETNTTMVTMSNDYRALKKQFPNVPKTLNEQSNVSGYTVGDALRVYMWSRDGHEIPGLSKTDQRRLIEHVENNPDYVGFSEGIISLQKNRGYPGPTENWLAGNVATDIIGGINSINRSDSLIAWQKNVDIIFSTQNMSKLEAAYGSDYVKNLKATLARMKSGRNRLPTGNQTTDNVLDWINNSVGNVMFLNTRSAALQTLSSVNFINWGDNNILNAGKAFANQPQYWSDFLELMNSDYLVNRREGLRINVTESEIADAVKDSKNKSKAAIAFLLNKGFVFTRYADSFAIASGGATFYRNRINTYLNEGMSEEDAKNQAFLDFHAISEETQQSADPSKISEQQSSNAGRIILAFANTPMQYARLQKRAAQDLMAGRGDYKEHISKLAYYGVAQNIIFNSLQQAFFTEMFEGEDDEGEDGPMGNKAWDIINGMSSSNLRGLGVGGATVDALKNSLITIAKESGKNSPDFTKAIDDLFDVAPPLDSKLRKLQSAAKTFSWNRKEIKEQGFDVDNPAILAGAQVISAFTNIPIDRAIMKLNNIRNVLGEESEKWQKVALLLGYSAWELGLPYYGVESPQEKIEKAEDFEKRKEDYNNDIRKLKVQGYKKVRKFVKGAITVYRPTQFVKSPKIEYWLKK